MDYKKYLSNKHYNYVSNFLEDLYRMYDTSCQEEPKTKDDNALLSAITAFLTKIYPHKLEQAKDLSTIQFIFILPSTKYTAKDFIEKFFRPILAKTPWIRSGDPGKKVLFFNKMESVFYYLNRRKEHYFDLKRERKYLICNLQNIAERDTLLITVNIARALYDPDFIAASKKSIALLDRTTILSPKSLQPELTLEISIPRSMDTLLRISKFLFLKIFANSDEEIIGDDTISDYYINNNKYYPAGLMRYLVFALSTMDYEVGYCKANAFVNANVYQNRMIWSVVLIQSIFWTRAIGFVSLVMCKRKN